ncbi:hypothetical protein FRC17_007946 [Serendipita sp. 399]|nr:hypothetical protein FRC17_007946 [Serendipita sp. 399]
MNLEVPPPSTLKVESHDQYQAPSFGPTSVHPNPLVQFKLWFEHARSGAPHEQHHQNTQQSHAVVLEPEAMSLATVTGNGVPSNRMVLLKEVDTKGFIFFTNYASRKSKELLANPHAALCFYWREIHRQVRVIGTVEKLDEESSDNYYQSRPVNSRVGAWASPQSQPIREDELQTRVKDVEEQFGINDEGDTAHIPRPEFWGGWRVIPQEVEFWSGRPNRLHDRVQYRRREASAPDAPEWIIERLAP